MKIKSIIFILVGIGMLSTIALISKNLRQKDLVNIQPIPLPNLTITRLDSSHVSLYELFEDTQLLLVLVNSECAICHGQVDELYKRGHLFENVKIVLLSYQELSEISDFYGQYPDAPFLFGQIDLHILNENFGDFSTPQLFLYNRQHQLIKELKGINRVVHLKQHFEQNIL